MKQIKELKASLQQCRDDAQAILDSANGNLTEEQQTQFDAFLVKAEGIQKEIDNHEKMAVLQAKTEAVANRPAPSIGRQVKPDSVIMDDPAAGPMRSSVTTVPARARRWAGNLQSFKGPNAEMDAYRAGMWLAASLVGSPTAKKYCAENGIPIQSAQFENLHQENVNVSGGYLVFPEYENSIIRLVEEYGLVRRKMRTVPMIGDTKGRPRRTGGLDAYFVGEGSAITESTGSWDWVNLVAKKLAAITTASNELMSDAIISIADQATMEIALAFATKEDLCGFQGDGTSTYGGMYGIENKLYDLNGVDDGGGMVVSTGGDTWGEMVDGDFMATIGRLPNYPGMQPEWYCSKPFWAGVMTKLSRAAGGTTMFERTEVQPRPLFAGYPVNLTSGTAIMPVVTGVSEICCLFGDMRMAADFGDRAGLALAVSTDAYVGSTSMFETDSFAIRGIERFDINVHDVGTATAAGPMVALMTAAT